MKTVAREGTAWHELWHALLRGMARRKCPEPCAACAQLPDCLRRGSLCLHGLPPEEGRKLLAARAAAGPCFLVADYALAERNLHVPSVWLCACVEGADGGHARPCAAFLRAGGLEGALRRAGIVVLDRRLAGCGLLTVARCGLAFRRNDPAATSRIAP